MDYYYDILLNFQEGYCMFYEWDENDAIDYIKKIPIYHVSSKIYNDFYMSKIKVSEGFLKEIENKTKLKQNGSLKYACIISDGKNSLGLEFNDKGLLQNKSSLILEDELNINEFMFNISLSNIDYEVVEKDSIPKYTRQEEKVKKLIRVEINDIYNKKNYSKLKYIYLEWFKELKCDYEEMYQEMLKKLDGDLTDREYNIYELIKLSYNNV